MKNEPITYQAEKAIQSSYIMPDYIDFVYSVCDNIGLPRPVVKDGRMCKNATFRQGPPIKIVLPKWSRTRLYMLHEIGHYIEYYTYGKTGHSKRFEIILAGLINIYMGESQLKDYEKAITKLRS